MSRYDYKEEDNCDWDIKLMGIQWLFNDSFHKITKCKPFRVLHNYKVLGLKGCLIKSRNLINI